MAEQGFRRVECVFRCTCIVELPPLIAAATKSHGVDRRALDHQLHDPTSTRQRGRNLEPAPASFAQLRAHLIHPRCRAYAISTSSVPTRYVSPTASHIA